MARWPEEQCHGRRRCSSAPARLIGGATGWAASAGTARRGQQEDADPLTAQGILGCALPAAWTARRVFEARRTGRNSSKSTRSPSRSNASPFADNSRRRPSTSNHPGWCAIRFVSNAQLQRIKWQAFRLQVIGGAPACPPQAAAPASLRLRGSSSGSPGYPPVTATFRPSSLARATRDTTSASVSPASSGRR